MTLTAFGDARFDAARVRARPVFYDFGANKGDVCNALLSRWPSARVMAFEPGPLRPKARKGLTVDTRAVSADFGEQVFHVCPAALQSSSLLPRPDAGENRPVTVACETLERLTAREGWIDAVSLDVEGAEWRILMECPARTLLKIDQLCVEMHMEFARLRTIEDLIDGVCHVGQFSLTVIRHHATRPVLLFVKRDMDAAPTPLRRAHNAWLRERFDGRTFGRALNLGCGTDADQEGAVYSSYLHAAEVVKADVVPAGRDVVRADACRLPFPDGSFDLVFANWVIYKAADRLKAMREVRRVLRPGGEAMLSVGGPDADLMEALHRTMACYFEPLANWRLDYAAARQALRGQALWGVRRDLPLCHVRPPSSATEGMRYRQEFGDVLLAHWDDDLLSAGHLLHIDARHRILVATDKAQDAGQRAVFERLWKAKGHEAITLDIPQRTRPMRPGESRVDYMQRAPRTVLTAEVLDRALRAAGVDPENVRQLVTHDDIGTTNWHPQHRQLRSAARTLFPQATVWLLNDRFGLTGGGFSGQEAKIRAGLAAYGLRPERAPRADYLIPAAAVEAALA